MFFHPFSNNRFALSILTVLIPLTWVIPAHALSVPAPDSRNVHVLAPASSMGVDDGESLSPSPIALKDPLPPAFANQNTTQGDQVQWFDRRDLPDGNGGPSVEDYPYRLELTTSRFQGALEFLTGLFYQRGLDVGAAAIEDLPADNQGRPVKKIVFHLNLEPGLSRDDLSSLPIMEYFRIQTMSFTYSDKQNEVFVGALGKFLQWNHLETLHPDMAITPDVNERRSKLRVQGRDHPGFLYFLIHALALRDARVQEMSIQTTLEGSDKYIDDTLYITDKDGKPIQNPEQIEEIKTTVSVLKKFMKHLPKTLDPFLAMVQFDKLVRNAPSIKEQLSGFDILKMLEGDDELLELMAQVLGSNPDFGEQLLDPFRFKNFLPLLRLRAVTGLGTLSLENYLADLKGKIAKSKPRNGQDPYEAKYEEIRKYKDLHLFRLQLKSLFEPSMSSNFFQEISDLGDALVHTLCELKYQELLEKGGAGSKLTAQNIPTPIRDRKASYVILGYGNTKLQKIGIGSDMDLQLFYDLPPEMGAEKGTEEKALCQAFFDQLALGIQKEMGSKEGQTLEIDYDGRMGGTKNPNFAFPLSTLESEMSAVAQEMQNSLFLNQKHFEGMQLRVGRPITPNNSDPILEKIRTLEKKYLSPKPIYAFSFAFPGMLKTAGMDIQNLKRTQFSPKLSIGGLRFIEFLVYQLQTDYQDAYPPLKTSTSIEESIQLLTEHHLLSPDKAEHLLKSYHFFLQLRNHLKILKGKGEPNMILDFTNEAQMLRLARSLGRENAEALKNEITAAVGQVLAVFLPVYTEKVFQPRLQEWQQFQHDDARRKYAAEVLRNGMIIMGFSYTVAEAFFGDDKTSQDLSEKLKSLSAGTILTSLQELQIASLLELQSAA